MLKLIVLAVLVYQANCFIQSYDYNDAIKKTEDLVIRPFVPEGGYGHVFERARFNRLPGLHYNQVPEPQPQPQQPLPIAPLPSSMPNVDEMVIKSLMTDMFGDRDAEILFNHKEEPHHSTQKVNKPSTSWMIEIAEEENSDMQVQDDKKIKQILEILGLESPSTDEAKQVVRPTWKNQNGEFFSQEFKQYLQGSDRVVNAPLTQAPVEPTWNLLNQQQQSNWKINQPSQVENSLDQLKEKILDSEKTFLNKLIKPQEEPEKQVEKPAEINEKSEAEYENAEIESNSEWNANNQEEDEDDGVEKLVAKQEEVMNAFAAHQTSDQIDSSYVFIELGEKIELDKAQQLLHYIAEFSQVPFESFKDLRLNGNLMVFKVDEHDQAKLNAWSISNSILSHKLKIWHALGQTVLSSGVGKDVRKTNESSNTVMIVAIVLSISISLCLAGLIICCMIKRKSQSLRDQLMAAGDVGLMKAANMKRGRDDEESLIRNNTTSSNWISYLPFIKRAQKDQARGGEQLSSQQDYQRMQSNMISTSIQNEVGTKISVTPVRVNSQDDE